LDAEVTWVSQIQYGRDELPFNSLKVPGFGHEHGPEAMNDYLENQGAGLGGLD
jgi:hypothetical protein